jgi:thiosulfate dehydrogenase
LAIPNTPEGDLIRYGRELVAHTAVYLGPSGKVAAISNGMNCQNCHLKAGKKTWGNNYAAVASTYPKFRPRSGTVETIERRVNDCLERSLNGRSLPEGSHELNAFVAYIRWVGKDVPLQKVPEGTGIVELPLPEEAANPAKGKTIYEARCARCHGSGGKGVRGTGQEWNYPPLWGPESFNTGAGLYRLSRMAGFIKMNMPYGVRADSTLLSDNEAWDVAAFINTQPRPQKDLSRDWPDLATKPFDYPFGPYADSFSEAQHKLGPFSPILAAKGKK